MYKNAGSILDCNLQSFVFMILIVNFFLVVIFKPLWLQSLVKYENLHFHWLTEKMVCISYFSMMVENLEIPIFQHAFWLKRKSEACKSLISRAHIRSKKTLLRKSFLIHIAHTRMRISANGGQSPLWLLKYARDSM